MGEKGGESGLIIIKWSDKGELESLVGCGDTGIREGLMRLAKDTCTERMRGRGAGGGGRLIKYARNILELWFILRAS